VGTGRAEDEKVELSTLIGKLNERFGTEFTPADQLFFDQIAESAVENDTLRAAAQANTLENFAYVFNRMLENLFIERMDGNEEIFSRLMDDDDFRRVAKDHLLHEVYARLQKEGAPENESTG
jgi:type I restriction enzyme R subunit